MEGSSKASDAPESGKKAVQHGAKQILLTLKDGILLLEGGPIAGTVIFSTFDLSKMPQDVGEKAYLMLLILGFLLIFLAVSIVFRVPFLFFPDKRVQARRSIVVLAVSLGISFLYLLALLFGIAYAPRL